MRGKKNQPMEGGGNSWEGPFSYVQRVAILLMGQLLLLVNWGRGGQRYPFLKPEEEISFHVGGGGGEFPFGGEGREYGRLGKRERKERGKSYFPKKEGEKRVPLGGGDGVINRGEAGAMKKKKENHSFDRKGES